ncbi:MAG TPA: hypothetical protein EYP04_03180 [Anaerolineae bacterium]|nr:hypothetical protein [Anaerolineae bacterium]
MTTIPIQGAEVVEVECRSEYAYAQAPRAFTWRGQRYEVVSILRRWRTPEAIWFRLLTTEPRRFLLAYDEQADVWLLVSPPAD